MHKTVIRNSDRVHMVCTMVLLYSYNIIIVPESLIVK